MAAINKNFIVKNGLQVGEDLIVSNETTNRVGIASTVPTHTLSVGGEVFADAVVVSGVSTLPQLKGTQLSYAQIDTDNLYAVSGVVTSLTGSNINFSGELKSSRLAIGVAGTTFSATSNGVGVGTTIPTKDFEVVGDVNVTGALSATVVNSDINSTGVSTFANADVEELQITNVNILGISTLGIAGATRLNVSGNTTLGITTTGPLDVEQINVVGVTTIGNLGVTQLNVSGFSTFSDRVDADDIFASTIDTGNLRATGITTLSTTSTNALSAAQLNVTGVSTFAGITTVTGSTLFSKQLNVSGVSTFSGTTTHQKGISVTGTANVTGVNATGIVTAASVSASGNITALDFDSTHLEVTGVTTTNVLRATNLNISGITTANVLTSSTLNVSGVTTVGSLTVATITPTTVNTTNLSVSGIGTFTNKLHLLDGDRLHLGGAVGDDGGLQIYHSGAFSYIQDDGSLVVNSDEVLFKNAANTENLCKFVGDGAIEFYYDNQKKLETTSGGIYVNNTVGINSLIPAGRLDVVGNAFIRGTISADGFSGPGIVTDIIDGAGSVAIEVTPGVYKIDLYGSAVGEAWGTVLNGSGEIGVRTDVLVGVGTTVPPEYTLDVYAKFPEEAARFLVQGSNIYAPFIVNSNVLVSNLNAQFLNGKSAPSGSIVGTTDGQTLSGKTLTLPTIQGTGANFSGSTSGTTNLKASAVAGSTTITLPATTGTVVTTGDSGTVTSTMIANNSIVNADINSSAAIAYSKLSLSNSIVNGDINSSAAIAVSKLAANTISGVTLGNNLSSLTIGSYMTQNGQTYNGSTGRTVEVDATSANTASKVVVRDGSGNFAAGTVTVNTLSGTHGNVTGISTLGNLKTLPLLESINVVAGTANATSNIDVLTSNVWLFTTNASGNWTHNIRGNASTSLNNIMATGDSLVVTILAKKSSTTHYATDITIDGSAQTELWLGGSAPSAGLSGSNYDMYTWTIIKTASATFTVLASQSQYGS